MKELKFFEKSVYGNTLIYPEPSIAGRIQRLVGRKTVDLDHLTALKELGFDILINKANFEATYL